MRMNFFYFLLSLLDFATVTHCLPGNLICSAGSASIFSLELFGEEHTSIKDEMTRCSPRNNYEDQNHLTVTFFANKAYTLRIRLHCVGQWHHAHSYGQDSASIESNCNAEHYLDVWLDMNNDGIFDDAKERLLQGDNSNRVRTKQDYSLSLTIPVIDREIYAGEPHRMRVILTSDENNHKPCYNNGYGEARDYMVHISQNPYY